MALYTTWGEKIKSLDIFENIPLGSYFAWGEFSGFKISSNYNYDKPKCENAPNAVNADNLHYCVFNPQTKVAVIKTPETF